MGRFGLWVRTVSDPMEQARAKRAMGYILLGLILLWAAPTLVGMILTGEAKPIQETAADKICGTDESAESVKYCRNAVKNTVMAVLWIGTIIALIGFGYNALRFFTSD